jgi:hypothetical protein
VEAQEQGEEESRRAEGGVRAQDAAVEEAGRLGEELRRLRAEGNAKAAEVEGAHAQVSRTLY